MRKFGTVLAILLLAGAANAAAQGQWTRGAPMPSARSEVAVA